MKNEFPVVELFDSIDGEGKRTGLMAIFVRFAGCNLRCTYCDTAYALRRSDALEVLTGEELLERIHKYPWKRITFTGGEPMLQNLLPLCQILSDEGYDINIETMVLCLCLPIVRSMFSIPWIINAQTAE